MKNIIKDKVFWIFFLPAAIFIFIVLADNHKTFEVKSRILFLPKSEAAVQNIGQIMQNAEQIPRSLSFYNKILELNGDIDDGALGLPDAERKDFWNGKIETKQVKKSGIIEISIFDANQTQAETISKQTVAGILTVMSNYYDIKNNLDMRVIDGSISQEITRMNYFQSIAASLAGGIVAGFLITLLINFLSELQEKRMLEKNSEAGNTDAENNETEGDEANPESFGFPKFSFPRFEEKKMPEEEAAAAEEKKSPFDFRIEDEAALVPPKKAGFFGLREKKSVAPNNLPVAENENEFVLDMSETKENPAIETVPEIPVIDHKREATPEEVKARLNKLLSGSIAK